jgi:hypothetical protein
VSTECGANPLDGVSTAVGEVRLNDLVLSVRTPGHPPSWNRVVATDETTVTFVNGARVTKTWLGSRVTVFRPRVILGGP